MFLPLSFIDGLGNPCLEWTPQGSLVEIVRCRMSRNMRMKTLEELGEQRKELMLAIQKILMHDTREALNTISNSKKKTPDDPPPEQGITVDQMMDDFLNLLDQTESQDAEMLLDDVTFQNFFNRSLGLKRGIERKWQLMHDEDIAAAGMKQRVMVTYSGRFLDPSFIWELRSKSDLVPFAAIITDELDVIPVPCLDNDAAAVMWECVLKHSPAKRVAIIGESGSTQLTVDAKDVLQGSKLVVDGRVLAHRQAGTLSSGFRLNPKLVSVTLSNAKLKDEGATALADNLAHCPWLLTLDIGENEITASGCRAISDVLANSCTSLTSLRLSWYVISRHIHTHIT